MVTLTDSDKASRADDQRAYRLGPFRCPVRRWPAVSQCFQGSGSLSYKSVGLQRLTEHTDRLLDFGTHLRVSKRWSFEGTTTRSKLWSLLRLHRTMRFANLRAFRFVDTVAHEYISHCIQNTDRVKKPGAYVATGSRDKTIKLWDTQSGQMLKNLVGVFWRCTEKWLMSLSARPDMTIGFEPSSSTPRGNFYFRRLTTRRYACGSCRRVGV